MVRLIFLIYWLLILEGALRKWGFPELKNLFFFIRIPIALVLYWLAISRKQWPKAYWPLCSAYAFASIALSLIPFQVLLGGYDSRYLLIAGYGWINYFFYIPMAFIIMEQFEAGDLRRFIRHSFWMALASVPLVILQFESSPTDVINLGSGLDESTQFQNLGSAMGYVRPTGFFSSTLGQSDFVASIAALALSAWLMPRRDRATGAFLFFFGMLAVLIMTAFSQSRTLFFMEGLILLSGVAAGIVSQRRQVIINSGVIPAVVLIMLFTLWPLFFQTTYEVFMERWIMAQENEVSKFEFGVFGRAFREFYGFIDYLGDAPLVGYLLGIGGNAAWQLDWVVFPSSAYSWTGYGGWGEDAWSRHIIELGPLLGLMFIIYRIAVTVWLWLLAVRGTRDSGNPLPMLLFGFIGPLVLIAQFTGHGTVNGYAWIFTGLLLASVKICSQGYLKPRLKRNKVVE
ncbi:hypothetical protein ABZN20_05445 [Methylococcus sp. ANG]|uniref:hypothetical protein n=1 Tax=Methylococcus sp. ANG TaxID=3231903 RepID=UPI00345B3BDE